ncbi:GGDEF domain-containing protein [Marinomonas sp. 5E14-1]|uniref:GGDEF domain-containing protein n=1 Tax=Marinomonas sp. 5E14-1 TaxID=3153922 RepID=UPI00326590DF
MKVLAEDIISNWVEIYAEKQLRYDKVRTLLPLIQEVELSKEFAEIDSIKNWANDPNNQELKEAALRDGEEFRTRFSDNSFFIALNKNNNYYYHDDEVKKLGIDSYRYTLDPNKPEDAWFYSIMKINLSVHLNVNPDVELGVVKLWSDVLIRKGNEILGVVGTGLDLSNFLDQMVEKQDIYSAIFFTNYEGSIQLHQEEALIDYASITKQSEDKKLIFQILDDEGSKAKLRNVFQLAKETPNSVKTAIVYKNDIRELASVIYIPEIDWFQVNFIDVDYFLPWTEFFSLFFVFLISLIIALIVTYLMIKLIVTKPIKELDDSVCALKRNKILEPKINKRAGLEIKNLVSHYKEMSDSILEYQNKLEEKVEERTKALSLLSQLDPLTSLYNRRGIELYLNEYMRQWNVSKQAFSIINIDINDFKLVNDKYGHFVGDEVLKEIANYLKSTLLGKGEVSRWGGDEFIITIKHLESHTFSSLLDQLINDSRSLILKLKNQELVITFSVGCTSIKENDTIESMLNRADKDMYSMKFSDN